MPPLNPKTSADSQALVTTRAASVGDIEAMLDLEATRRKAYQEYQPEFWQDAPNSRESQREYFQELLTSNRGNALVRVAEAGGRIMSFAIGYIAEAPPVYKSQKVCFIDDFPLAEGASWSIRGRAALEAVETEAKAQGATLTNVVCAEKDVAKRDFLRQRAFTVASEWWVGNIRGS